MVKEESKKLKYPHLLPEETKVWRRFLEKYEELFDRFDYDVHVGKGTRPPAPPGEIYADNFQRLTQKRIDAVGWIGKKPTIFEVRPYAGFHLLGKLKGYRWFWMQKFPEEEPPTLGMVCEYISNEDREYYHAEDVHVFVV